MIQQSPKTDTPLTANKDTVDAKVVVLNNYFRVHHTAVYQEVVKRVPNLSILLSTPMESDRNWQANWGTLDVIVQKNWTYTAKWKHSSGFKENNYIHFPVDTIKRLKALQPDVVFSYELGFRTLLSSRYCRKHKIPLVMVGNMSELIESDRGMLRKKLRHFLKNRVDFFTYNGPSCKRYLESLGINPDRLLFLPYAYDAEKAYHGPIQPTRRGPIRLVFCGALDPRKGLPLFLIQLERWCLQNSDQEIELHACGTGRSNNFEKPNAPNLKIHWEGHLESKQLAEMYSIADICVFPTLADEWGLVPVESLASGTPVLGSIYAQSVESLIREGCNGWTYRPDDAEEFYTVLDRALRTPPIILDSMANGCRQTVSHIHPASSADWFVKALNVALQTKKEKELRS
jgi:glycosyltransferase involved in cell wall biosynthesis